MFGRSCLVLRMGRSAGAETQRIQRCCTTLELQFARFSDPGVPEKARSVDSKFWRLTHIMRASGRFWNITRYFSWQNRQERQKSTLQDLPDSMVHSRSLGKFYSTQFLPEICHITPHFDHAPDVFVSFSGWADQLELSLRGSKDVP